MGTLPLDLGSPSISPQRRRDVIRRSSGIDVKAHLGVPQITLPHRLRPKQANLLGNRKKQRDRGMGNVARQERLGQGYQARNRRTVICAEPGASLRNNPGSLSYRHRPLAERDRVHVASEQQAWTRHRAGNLHDQVPNLHALGNA